MMVQDEYGNWVDESYGQPPGNYPTDLQEPPPQEPAGPGYMETPNPYDAGLTAQYDPQLVTELGNGDASLGSKILGWLSQALGLSQQNIKDLISLAGGAAALGLGIYQGKITADQIKGSLGQTAQYNQQAATQTSVLSNPNIQGVYGSRMWSGPDASGRYTATDTLSPEQQQLYNQTVGVAGQRNTATGQILGSRDWSQSPTPGQIPTVDISRMGQGIQTGLDFSGAGPIQKSLNFGAAGPIQRSLDFSAAGPIQRSVNLDQYGRPVTDPGRFGPIQSDLNYMGAPAMPVANQQVRDQVVQNFILQQKPYFDQEWSRRLSESEAQLRAEGIMPGSEAYNKQMDSLDDQMARAWNEVTRNAVVEGTNAMNVLFGEQMASRQQGVGEINTQGQFHNTAQGQGAEQLLARAALANAGQAQGVNQALAAGQFANQAQLQGANQIYQQGMFGNQAQQQGANQIYQAGLFGNQAQQQAANQIYQAGTFANAAQNQALQQYLSGTALNQNAATQGWNQQLQSYFAPINAATAMQAGGQPTVPQFGPTTGATVGQATYNPLGTAVYGANAQQGTTNQATGFLSQTLPTWLTGG